MAATAIAATAAAVTRRRFLIDAVCLSTGADGTVIVSYSAGCTKGRVTATSLIGKCTRAANSPKPIDIHHIVS